MNNVFGPIFSAIAVALVILIYPLLGVMVGAFCGWVVGAVFDQTFRVLLTAMDLAHLAPWQVGAALGFVAGFFNKTSGQISS